MGDEKLGTVTLYCPHCGERCWTTVVGKTVTWYCPKCKATGTQFVNHRQRFIWWF